MAPGTRKSLSRGTDNPSPSRKKAREIVLVEPEVNSNKTRSSARLSAGRAAIRPTTVTPKSVSKKTKSVVDPVLPSSTRRTERKSVSFAPKPILDFDEDDFLPTSTEIKNRKKASSATPVRSTRSRSGDISDKAEQKSESSKTVSASVDRPARRKSVSRTQLEDESSWELDEPISSKTVSASVDRPARRKSVSRTQLEDESSWELDEPISSKNVKVAANSTTRRRSCARTQFKELEVESVEPTSTRKRGKALPLSKAPVEQQEPSKGRSTSRRNSGEQTPIKPIRIRRSLIDRSRKIAAQKEISSSDSEEYSEEIGEVDYDRVPLKVEIDENIKPLMNRENEFNSLKEWVSTSMKEKSPLTVYISGPPGTGKTATTSLILDVFSSCSYKAHISCVTIKNLKELIKAIMGARDSKMEPNITGLSMFLSSLEKPLIIILDEVDHLSTTSNTILYSAFKWPYELSSNLILIGIANSIDLTERVLPKLKLIQAPKRLLFSPYTVDKIAAILTEKMKNDENQMDAKAIELCARKVAATSGDMRSALLVFKQTKNKMASMIAAGNTISGGGVREVLGVLGNVYCSPITKARLPLQSELLLAVCLTMSTNNKTPLTVNGLFNSYSKACDLTNIPELENDDLNIAFQTLESQSFITVAKNGQIRLQVDAKTVQAAISSNGMIEQVKSLRI